jgi:hypothetical protein
MPQVLRMPAFQIGHPVPLVVTVKTDNDPVH